MTYQHDMEQLDREIAERRERLNHLKRQQAARPADGYSFVGANGAVGITDLFGEKDDLIVVHNMGRRCPYCTMWGDGLNGLAAHIQNRCALVVVSPDDPATQAEFAVSRGWRFPMVSDADGRFTRDMGYLIDQEGRSYWLPGYSTFHRDADGAVRRVGSDFFGPGDMYCGAWPMFDMLLDGPGDWQPAITY